MSKRASSMRFLLCSLGFLFLFNPNINIIDVLPDAPGYLLLTLGLSRLGELNESVAGAVRGFRNMILVDLCKLPALVWVFGLSVPSERNSSLLLWAFVFAVLELLLALPAYLKLFEGLGALGFLYPNSSLLVAREGSGRSRTDRIKRLTVVFLFCKTVLSVLPELADLGNASYDETAGAVNLYRYIGVMRFLAFLPALAVGVIWLARILSYWRAIRKDEALTEGLERDYREKVLPRRGMFIRRDTKTAFLLILTALILTADLRLDGWNILPDILAAVCLLFAFLYLGRHNGKGASAYLPPLISYAVLTLAEAFFESAFLHKYSFYSIIRSEEAMQAFCLWEGALAIKAAAFLWTLACLVRSLSKTVDLHTGTVEGREYLSEREDALAKEMRRELKVGLWIAFAVAALAAAADLLFPILSVYVDFMGLVHTLAVASMTTAFALKISATCHAVNTRYQLS